MTAVFAAASLLLAGGAGVLSSLLVAPVRGAGRMVALLLASVAAVGLGLLLLVGPVEPAFFLTGFLTGSRTWMEVPIAWL
ncbi:hypothetical protein [Falsiroseomonas sp. E2-1-a4]|uniref:hypothetical protein n=1 Tax=Falsiroseomonas sp. E2-1-a4 TaxID=3239299 RepID=UPI003F2F0665